MSFSRIRKEAEKMLKSKSHDWSHVERVYRLCMHIGKKENADMEILALAAILHDIGREHEKRTNGKICHAEYGAVMAKKILKKYNFDKAKSDRIIHCIGCHRFRGSKKPKTKEAKVLFDADKLDSIGAIGIGRAFLFAGEVGAKVHNKGVDIENTGSYTKEDTAYREFLVKLSKLKGRMMTREGKRMVKARHSFMVNFFNRLNKEVDGEI